MSFKYTSKFQIKANLRKEDFEDGSLISKAGIKDDLASLKVLLPDAGEILDNPDLLYTCFNAAVVNLVNLNNDGLTTEGAKKLVQSTRLKPVNIEHDRYSIVGVITDFAFSSFKDNSILKEDKLDNDPFNLSLGAIVWKVANRGFADFLEETQDEEGYCYMQVAASWEIGFNSYKIALGSKDLRKAKIIEDEKEIENYAQYLLQEGGTGFTPSGEEVYRVIGDDCRFLGCAFTTNPAAAVKGILAADYKSLAPKPELKLPGDASTESKIEEISTSNKKLGEIIEFLKDEKNRKAIVTKIRSNPTNTSLSSEESVLQAIDNLVGIDSKSTENLKKFAEDLTEIAASVENKEKNLQKNDKEISHSNKTRVIKCMKYQNVDELADNVATASAGDVREFVRTELEKANTKFVNDRAEKEQKIKELEDALASAKAFEAKTKELDTQISTLKASIKAQEDQTKFNERMEALKEKFELDAGASKSLAKQINGLSDEAFAEWLGDHEPLLKVKSAKKDDEPNLEIKAAANPSLPNAQGGDTSKKQKMIDALSAIKVTVK